MSAQRLVDYSRSVSARGAPISSRRFSKTNNFTTEGRALLNSGEASSFIVAAGEKGAALTRTVGERPFMFYVGINDLSRTQVIKTARKAALWVEPEEEYISPSLTKTEALQRLMELVRAHGFDPAAVSAMKRGLIFLTDNFSMEFNRQVTQVSQECVKRGLEKVIELVDTHVQPVFTDDCIVRAFYSNRSVSQSVKSMPEEDDDCDSDGASIDDDLKKLEAHPQKLRSVAEKLVQAETEEERTELITTLDRAIENLDKTVNEASARVKGAEGEANMRILSLEGRLEDFQERLDQRDQDTVTLTESLDRTESNHEKEISKLRKNHAQAVELLTLEKELLSQQVEKLQAKAVSKTQKQTIHIVSSSDSDTDAYEEEHRFAGKVKHKSPIVATVGTDQGGSGETDTKPITVKDRFVATPAKFGMKTWDEDECSILEHLSRLDMGLEQAVQKGCTLQTQQNLVLMTLPTSYDWASDFMEAEDRSTMAKFKAKLTELICGTDADQTSALLSAHRRENENILSYFRRLKSLYAYCTNEQEDSSTSTYGLYTFYNKLAEAMPQVARIEFTRLCEAAMAEKKFTFENLKKFTVLAARKAPKTTSPMLAQMSSTQQNIPARSPEGGKVPSSGPEEPATREQTRTGYKETRECFECHKVGHIAKNCYARKRRIQRERQAREKNDSQDGNRA